MLYNHPFTLDMEELMADIDNTVHDGIERHLSFNQSALEGAGGWIEFRISAWDKSEDANPDFEMIAIKVSHRNGTPDYPNEINAYSRFMMLEMLRTDQVAYMIQGSLERIWKMELHNRDKDKRMRDAWDG